MLRITPEPVPYKNLRLEEKRRRRKKDKKKARGRKWVDFPDCPKETFCVCWPVLREKTSLSAEEQIATICSMRRALKVALKLLLPANARPKVIDDDKHGLAIYLPMEQKKLGYRVAGICTRVVGSAHLCCRAPITLRKHWFTDDKLQHLRRRTIERRVARQFIKAMQRGLDDPKDPEFEMLMAHVKRFGLASCWYRSDGPELALRIQDASRGYWLNEEGFY